MTLPLEGKNDLFAFIFLAYNLYFEMYLVIDTCLCGDEMVAVDCDKER